MRLVVQRVASASVAVEGEVLAAIGPGLLVLAGVGREDTAGSARRLGPKVANLRIFADGEGRMNRSVRDVGGEVLVVSQFTLYGDARRGNRPSFVEAAPPEVAQPLVDELAAAVAEAGVPVRKGRFQAHMQVSLVNDGPVTILLEG